MKNWKLLSSGAAVALLLAACSESNDTATETEAQQAQEAASQQTSTVDTVVEKVKEEAAKLAEAVELDMSSMESFKESLAAMKANLSAPDQEKLTSALSSLAKDAVKDDGGLLGAAKSVASGKSTEEVLYDKMKSKLDGLSFDDILKLAN